jgi:predicted methyltransferase
MKRNLWMAASAALLLCVSGAQAAPPANIAAAVADTSRPATDVARDSARKPAEMLEFAGVKTGDKVGELLPGGGYFTRVLSAAVGPGGKVYAAVPADDLEKAKAAAKGNVQVVALTPASLGFPEPVDMIFTAQNYHDFHLKRLNLDISAVTKSFYDALKPGGILLIIDHSAVAGGPIELADSQHRIDPAIVRREVEAAGFKFVGENNALRNPADPKTAGVFDASIRGKTDQFVYKFQKPS